MNDSKWLPVPSVKRYPICHSPIISSIATDCNSENNSSSSLQEKSPFFLIEFSNFFLIFSILILRAGLMLIRIKSLLYAKIKPFLYFPCQEKSTLRTNVPKVSPDLICNNHRNGLVFVCQFSLSCRTCTSFA